MFRASDFAAVLAQDKVPVVVLNACQSGAVGKKLEASIATALLNAGCAAVVAMAYSVYAVAAAEFMAQLYESLFAGASVGQAVSAGRRRLFDHNGRASLRGDLPLADWLVPVHYMRREVRFPQARTLRPAVMPSLDQALDQIRAAHSAPAAAEDSLAAMGGVFVGRDSLFYQLEAAALSQRVVVLTGPAGAGKTELAKGFARWWQDTGGVNDPQLVFWHSFEPGVASFGLDGVITSLGLAVFGPDFARLDPQQRPEAVKQLLAQHRALLVWDNFESVREMPDPTGATPPLGQPGCAALKAFLEWLGDHSRSFVLITSRAQEAWLGQVSRITVGGLNRAEAAAYAGRLLDPYEAAQRRRERRSFGELLEWLDGHPLSMRLILPRLDTTDPLDLLADLQGVTPLPTADDSGAGRMTSLPASITYSYAHLAEQTRRLLPAVSLFHGATDEDILTVFSRVQGVPVRFAGASGQEWTAVLQDAARVGLLTDLGAGLYWIHPALPSYLAAEWQAENPAVYAPEREACERALCSACASFGQRLTSEIESGDAGFAYAILGWQRRTLGAMLGHALRLRAWNEAEAIVVALDSFWDTHGLDDEAATWADRIVGATAGLSQTPPESARSLWMYTIGRRIDRQRNAGQLDQAEQTSRRALTYLQDQPRSEWTRSRISAIYHLLGMIAQDRHRLDEAEDWYRKCLRIDEELGDRAGMAATFQMLGITAQTCGRMDEAEDWYRKSLTINEERGNRLGVARIYHQLGIIAHLRARLEEAEDWGRKSLAIVEELGDRQGVARVCIQLGTIARDQGRLDEAKDWYRQALTIEELLGNRPNIAMIYHQLGTIAREREEVDEAEDWYRKSLAIRQELGNSPEHGQHLRRTREHCLPPEPPG